MRTISYSTRSSKRLVFGSATVVIIYLLLRSLVPTMSVLGDRLAVVVAIAGALLAHQQRETVGVRDPLGSRERKRLRWSYVVAATGGFFGAAALLAIFVAFANSGPTFYWLIGAGLMAVATVNREVADWLYEPFVIRPTARAYGS